MRTYSYSEQREILGEAFGFLGRHLNGDILAYRAGNFNANIDTLTAAEEVGLKFTSISNLASKGSYDLWAESTFNDVHEIGNPVETPVTCFRQFPLKREWNSFQICAASCREMEKALEFYGKEKIQLVTFLTHSFEFVKAGDVQWEKLRPRKWLIKRFESIARYLAENGARFEVTTYHGLMRLLGTGALQVRNGVGRIHRSPASSTVSRYFQNWISDYKLPIG